jgi:FKBP-type peptidyl-prolyl cis-trans isomerase 2
MKSRAFGLVLFTLGMGLFGGEAAMAVVQDPAVGEGMTVTLEYTLTLPDKTVADSNVGKAPFSYVHGAGQIVPGLERALVGMKKGQTKHVEVTAVEGYGTYDMKKRVSVEKAKLPDGLKVGDLLQSPDGQLVTVLKIEDAQALLDLNHPLAGKNLTFDVKVLNVEKTEADKAESPTK